ncbi:alkaline phosphatase PhoX [Pacificimonas flava]|uniref:Phosphatase n=1 Tax=Pacificimonas flava TaxID=1234595 RepID=M2U3G2_9SPHN|nr:alkaline phosphatase PhoX [Pacificimonas flava]EMD82468.1 hypothetical protein C725_2189 [Pacificimonas flava]MBB5281300.1 hypothetical protein [Pacificimonas flava]
MKPDTLTIGRRGLFRGAGSVAAGAALAGPLGMLAARRAEAATTIGTSPYGPVSPTKDLTTGLELLRLPKDFSYRSMSWTGMIMANGDPVPPRHDGMCCIPTPGTRGQEFTLIRNHENGQVAEIGTIDAPGKYDTTPAGGIPPSGGTTNITVRRGQYVETVPSLGGTLTNCAGGMTPWGTWLSCEETTTTNPADGTPHGFVFEVSTDPKQTTGNPITEMGRMSHEAVAVDPGTGSVYLTEDSRNKSGFYRFEPSDTSGKLGSLARGGKLTMAKVVGATNAALNNPSRGDAYQLEWVDVEEPSLPPVQLDGFGTVAAPFAQGYLKGGAYFSRGEGIWWSATDRLFYWVDTGAGSDGNGRAGYGEGAVWAYDPATERMECIFASETQVAGNNPDNITVSPRGGIVLCEDGGATNGPEARGARLLGLLPNGEAYTLGINNVELTAQDIAKLGGRSSDFFGAGDYRSSEWCGACFDPTGRILFVNLQTPGITLAISGPWQRGNL